MLCIPLYSLWRRAEWCLFHLAYSLAKGTENSGLWLGVCPRTILHETQAHFFADTLFAIDSFHAKGHTKCAPSAFLSTYAIVDPQLAHINSSAAECGNGGLNLSATCPRIAWLFTQRFFSLSGIDYKHEKWKALMPKYALFPNLHYIFYYHQTDPLWNSPINKIHHSWSYYMSVTLAHRTYVNMDIEAAPNRWYQPLVLPSGTYKGLGLAVLGFCQKL